MAPAMKNNFSRRSFLQSSTLAAACGRSRQRRTHSAGKPFPPRENPRPFISGLASYTFRNFTRAQLIGFMKQLNVTDLNCKDVKDHLPMDPALESAGAR